MLGRLLTTGNVLHLTDGVTLMLEASGTTCSGGVRGHFARIRLCQRIYKIQLNKHRDGKAAQILEEKPLLYVPGGSMSRSRFLHPTSGNLLLINCTELP